MTRAKLLNYGMFYMLLGAFVFSLMNSSLKALSTTLTIHENLFFRGAVMCVFILPLLFLKKRRQSRKIHKHPHKKGGWGRLFFRAFIGSLSLYALLYNIAHIPLGVSVAFAQSAPIYTAIFAWLFLGEKITSNIALSVLVGFLGVLLISDPFSENAANLGGFNIICGVSSAVFASLAFISIRSLRGFFGDLEIMLSFGAMSALMGLAAIFWQGGFSLAFSPIDSRSWGLILAVGFTGTVGQFLVTRAYMFAPAAIVAPIDYARIAFSAAFGMILGDSMPDFSSLGGMFLIIFSGVLIALPLIAQELKKIVGRQI